MRNDMVKEFENIKAVRSLRTARHPEPEGWSEPIHDALIAGRACSVHFINDDEGKGIFRKRMQHRGLGKRLHRGKTKSNSDAFHSRKAARRNLRHLPKQCGNSSKPAAQFALGEQ